MKLTHLTSIQTCNLYLTRKKIFRTRMKSRRTFMITTSRTSLSVCGVTTMNWWWIHRKPEPNRRWTINLRGQSASLKGSSRQDFSNQLSSLLNNKSRLKGNSSILRHKSKQSKRAVQSRFSSDCGGRTTSGDTHQQITTIRPHLISFPPWPLGSSWNLSKTW